MFSTFKKFKTKLLVINREYSTSLITKRQIYIMKTILEKKDPEPKRIKRKCMIPSVVCGHSSWA